MSYDSYAENSRRGPKSRDVYDIDNRFGESSDSRRRVDSGMNGHSSCDSTNEGFFSRREKFRDESKDFGGDNFQRCDDESDEEGEVKESGATRDLREEIEAKRVRRQGSKVNLNSSREDIVTKRQIPVAGYVEGSCRREQSFDEPQDMNGSLLNRRSESRRPAPDFRRNVDDGEINVMRRRPSPEIFRPREVGVMGLRRISPSRRPSPGLRRSLGRSSSPNRRNPTGFPQEQHVDNRFFVEARGLSREPRDHDFREHQSPGRFGAVAGPGFMREVAPPPLPRTTTIHIRNLPPSLSVERLKGDLFQDCCRFGRVLDICVEFRGNERHAFVTFAEPTMAEDARRHMNRINLHGSMLDVELEFSNALPSTDAAFWRKSEDRDPAPLHMQAFQEEMDDPSSNCRVIVEDLDERLQDSEVLNKFKSFGAVETFDIQRERGRLTAIIRFRSLSSAVRARREMNGQPFGDRRCRVDYRFADPTCELWVGGVHVSVTEADVNREFSRFGRLCKVQINRANKCAFVLFDRVEDAVQAAANMRGRVLGCAAWKLKVDFADRSLARSNSPGPGRHFARFGKAGAMRLVPADTVPPQQALALHGSAQQISPKQGPPQVSSHQGPSQQVQPQQIAAEQQRVRQEVVEADAASDGSACAQVQPEKDSTPLPENAAPVPDAPTNSHERTSSDSAADSSASNVVVGAKRREPEGARSHGSHLEKKALSIVVESSSSTSLETPFQANGHCSFDCLTARPGAAGDVEQAAGGEAESSPTRQAHAEAMAEGAEEASSADPLERFPELWRGLAVVKGSAAGVVLRSVKCEDRLARDMLVGERVTMTQRMRLGEEQMKEFGHRLQSTGEASRGVLLAVPASAEDGPLLRQLFVSYLVERNAAGVARLETGLLYLFPPGSELASEYQKSASIDLSHHPDYLLVILLQDL